MELVSSGEWGMGNRRLPVVFFIALVGYTSVYAINKRHFFPPNSPLAGRGRFRDVGLFCGDSG